MKTAEKTEKERKNNKEPSKTMKEGNEDEESLGSSADTKQDIIKEIFAMKKKGNELRELQMDINREDKHIMPEIRE